MLVLLLAAILVGRGIGFETGLIYDWIRAPVNAQLDATAGVLIVATVRRPR